MRDVSSGVKTNRR